MCSLLQRYENLDIQKVLSLITLPNTPRSSERELSKAWEMAEKCILNRVSGWIIITVCHGKKEKHWLVKNS